MKKKSNAVSPLALLSGTIGVVAGLTYLVWNRISRSSEERFIEKSAEDLSEHFQSVDLGERKAKEVVGVYPQGLV